MAEREANFMSIVAVETVDSVQNATESDDIWDVVIVGAGPAGLTAGSCAARAGLRTLILDRLGGGGGQLLQTDLIENYPCISAVTGVELAQRLEDQARAFGAHMVGGEAIYVEPRGDLRIVQTTVAGVAYRAKAVIVSAGGRPRELGVAGEERLRSRGVSSCAICDGPFVNDKVVAVVGGGDSAVQEAAYLTRFARQVYLIHRRATWRAQPALQRRALRNPMVYSNLVCGGGGDWRRRTVEWLRYRDLHNNQLRRLDVDAVFVYVGFVPNGQVCGSQCERDRDGFLVTDHAMQTTLSGVFVAGDIRSQYVRQIAKAVGDATTAAVAAMRYVEELAG
jgi:thioredoxin reductase (NADPH)